MIAKTGAGPEPFVSEIALSHYEKLTSLRPQNSIQATKL
jgi:hypothetical protein